MEDQPIEGTPPGETASRGTAAEDARRPSPADAGHSPEGAPSKESKTAGPSWAALPLGPADAPRLELLLARQHDRPGTNPFVRLGTDGLLANVYLARAATAGGRTVRPLALKIQRDAYDNEVESRAGTGRGFTNRTLEVLWNQEYQRLRAVADDPEPTSFASLVELLPAAADGRAPVFEPLLFSRSRRAFFRIPCPRGAGFLTDCTDDALLAQHRLPEYRETNVRYLYSPALVERSKEAPPAFYRLHPSERDEERGVHGFDDLLRHLAESEDTAALVPDAPWNDQALAARGPDERLEALLDDLFPLSFHRFRAFPLAVLRLRHHEFAACLGGIGWDEFLETFRGPRPSDADEVLLQDLPKRLASGRLFAGDPAGREALEVLALKVDLILQLVAAVRAHHERFSVPHLDLRPDNVLVDLPPAQAPHANWWTFRAALIDLAGTTTLELGGGDSIPRPPVNFHEIYTSPIVAGVQFGHLHRGDLVVEAIEDVAQGTRVRVRLRSDLLTPRDHTARDTLRFTFQTTASSRRLQLWARMDGARWSEDGREFAVETLPMALNERTRASLEGLRGRWQQNAPYEMYHAIGYACDVYSLGVLLFQTLLSNRAQRMGDLRRSLIDAVGDHVTRLERETPGIAVEELTACVHGLLSDHPLTGVHNLFHDADPERASAIPSALWRDLLTLGTRMVTNVPGFSYCPDRSAPAGDARTPLVDVALDLAALRREIHGLLFGCAVDPGELHAALELARQET